MGKRVAAAAILMSAVMMLVVAAPSVVTADTHHIVKGEQGPRASAVSWYYTPADYGVWVGHVVNSGLRSLVIEVEDVTTGAPVSIMQQRIRFAAYPTDIVDTNRCIVAMGHTYLVTATPNGPRGSSCYVEDMYVIPPIIHAEFTYEVDGMTVIVDGSGSFDSSGWIEAWGWDWGDGTTGTGVITSHTYSEMGLYTIVLTVLGSSGYTASTSLSVIADYPPVASFTWTYWPDWYSVLVDASTSYDAGGVITSYSWDFGDGITATGMTASHQYMAIGFYEITLVVADNFGLTNSTTQIVPISPVVVTFTYTVSDLTVAVDASAVSDPYWAIASYDWNWGDGTTGTGMTATHTYATGGMYLIRLTVTFDNGITYILVRDVTVGPGMPPVPSFTYSVLGFTVAVDGSASTDEHGIANYVWDWGDGSPTSNGVTATHSYTGYYSGGAVPIPFSVFGYVFNPDGTPVLSGSVVRLQNVRTGGFLLTSTDTEFGFYMSDLNMLPGGLMMGDVVNVTVWGAGLVGYNEAIISFDVPYLGIDVTLSNYPVPPLETTVTLTVYNTNGLSSSVSHEIVFVVP